MDTTHSKLRDYVQYLYCRRCWWAANVQGIGVANTCPECQSSLHWVNGTVSEVGKFLSAKGEDWIS